MANAAGLGRLTVLSQLGQPLNAEIELVSLQPGEEESLSARIASNDAFSQAGIEMSPSLIGVNFTVERKGARPLLRMRTSQPLNEPFLEVLIEVQWASGKLVREYSFLLDPPEYKGPQPIATKPAAAPSVKPAPVAAPSKPEERPIAAAPAAAPTVSAAPKAAAGTYEVKKGDTLGKIAGQNAGGGVTLQQMLVALYRANQDAFIGENMNLLRSGRILTIPDRETAAAIEQSEAVRQVRTQSADFAAYQQKVGAEVARAPAAPAAAKREASGQITAKPAAKPPAEPKDQLKLSKTDPSKPAAAAGKAARGDDAVARERALKEAQSRVQDLEKNVSDLQKLLELKNQQLAEIEKKEKGAQKPAAVAKAPEPAKPEAKAAPKEPAKAEPAKAEPAKADAPKAEPPKPEAAKAEPPKPKPEAAKAETPKPEAPKPAAEPMKTDVAKAEAPKAKPKAVAPPPPPPPSMVDEFLDSPIALGGLGGVAALLAGYGAWAWRRKKATQSSKFQDSVLGGADAGGTASVLNAGAAAPAEAASVSSTSISDASVGAAASDDVDPIAEADVYMAYGRDAQAEEILKEALAKDANRPNVLAKLLEIYANRRDAKSFEASALKLKSLTGGEGADWDKAAALGRSIDPGNGLYGGSGEAAAGAAPAAPVAAPALDFDIGGGGEAAPGGTDVSLDLGGSGGEAAAPGAAMDFDLGGDTTTSAPAQADSAAATSMDLGGLDFDLGGDTPVAAAPAPAPAADAGGGMDFDLNLDLGTPASAAPVGGDTALDLSGLSLDLGGAPAGDAGGGAGGEKWQEVATKLDLAKAYEEMGDKDGARDLLNEVMKDGDAAQQAQAQQMLAGLG